MNRIHGGPDDRGPVALDFSTNANACGPCPVVLAGVQAADARAYPDPAYRALRERLAEFHGVAAWRVLPAASASEAIMRFTARAVQRGVRRVAVPRWSYGDYWHAAQAWSLPLAERGPPDAHTLRWACDPSSPLGQSDPPEAMPAVSAASALPPLEVLDCAYAPLRLSGKPAWTAPALDRVWQMWTPNKALGMTGLRAAYCIAPQDAADEAAAFDRLAASWPIGSHGVAMLQAWCSPQAQAWLAECRDILRHWKRTQQAACEEVGWSCLPSEANFFVCRTGAMPVDELLPRLRRHGIKVRDCASFGLPGHLRLGVLRPQAQQALARAVVGGDATTIHPPT